MMIKLILGIFIFSSSLMAQDFKYFTINHGHIWAQTVDQTDIVLEEKLINLNFPNQDNSQHTNFLLSNNDSNNDLFNKLFDIFLGGDLSSILNAFKEIKNNSDDVHWETEFGLFKLKLTKKTQFNIKNKQRWWNLSELHIEIDAQNLLRKLQEAEIINISDENLKIFAGLIFKRVLKIKENYSSESMARNQNLVPYLKKILILNSKKLFNLPANLELSSMDSLNLNYKLSYSIPVYQYFSIGQVLLGSFQSFSEKTAAVFDGNTIEINGVIKRLQNIQYHADIKLEFLKLLKFTFFKASLEYENTRNSLYKIHVYKNDPPEDSVQKQILQFLAGNLSKYNDIKSYIIEWKDLINQITSSSANFLAWTQSNRKAVEKKFYYHNHQEQEVTKTTYTKTKTTKSFLGVLLSILSENLLGSGFNILNSKIEIQEVSVEHLEQAQSLKHPYFITYKDELILSKKKLRKRHKRKISNFIKNKTYLALSALNQVELMKGFVHINQVININPKGIEYFFAQSLNNITYLFQTNCSHHKKKRKIKRCVKTSLNLYNKLITAKKSNKSKQIKNCLKKLLSNNQSLYLLKKFFGNENVFVYGKLYALTKNNDVIDTPYTFGLFSAQDLMGFLKPDQNQVIEIQ